MTAKLNKSKTAQRHPAEEENQSENENRCRLETPTELLRAETSTTNRINATEEGRVFVSKKNGGEIKRKNLAPN